MTNGLKKIKKATMAELIIDQILKMIGEGTFVPGEKLPSEKELADILCVSRPTLREAMRALMTMGLIEIRCGDGTYLNDSVSLLSEHFKNTHLLNRYSFNELIDTRLLLETEMARLAAQNASEEDLKALDAARQAVEDSLDAPSREFHSTEQDFHLAVAACSKNRFMREMLRAVEDLIVMLNVSFPANDAFRSEAIDFCRKITEAIHSGDAAAASESMHSHLAAVKETIGSQLSAQHEE